VGAGARGEAEAEAGPLEAVEAEEGSECVACADGDGDMGCSTSRTSH
jgi:hypothetical protein